MDVSDAPQVTVLVTGGSGLVGKGIEAAVNSEPPVPGEKEVVNDFGRASYVVPGKH